ncbi:MAG TPA: isochorismatase family cysteine hydrolase [Ktedonobacterales bacterium]|jgi:nicotinamidase-related amidase|nr:isochorismatase family cysteine hydrolase [Ktedonobacterales bacterium]
MITVEGKQVYTTLEELADPAHTALVVVDMQHDFCEPGGAFDQLGIDLAMYPPMIPRLGKLISAARDVGVPVVYIQMTVLPGRRSESPAQIRFNLRMHLESHGTAAPLLYTIEGTPGQAIISALAPELGDLIVRKYRSSGFWGTNLDMLLRSNGIETIIMTGCTTEGCVESTARDALFNDYYVVVAEDCVASDDRRQHEASLLLMRHRFDVVESSAIVGVWAVQAGVKAPARNELAGAEIESSLSS